MNIVRRGPGHILVKSSDAEMTKKAFEEKFECLSVLNNTETVKEEYVKAISLCDSDDTIVMIVPEIIDNQSVEVKDVKYMVTVAMSMTDLIIDLYNVSEEMGIEKIRRSIDRILMRITGNQDEYIKAVCDDVEGQVLVHDEYYEPYMSGTFIAFTEKGLDDPVDYSDFIGKVVRTDMKRYDTLDLLENNRLKYVNASIENKDWTALNIKIYDSFEQFELHYKRLVNILNAVDAGLVLGESWGKDSAAMFLSVGVYSVRLYTYLDPKEIKKILLGLEYKEDGKRVVDYDLFIKRRKIHWNDVRVDSLYRDELGVHYRKELMERLGEEDLNSLLEIEKDIMEDQ